VPGWETAESRLFCGLEVLFAYAADGTYPILGKIFKSRAGSNTVIGIANFRIILITAYIAYIFFHCIPSCLFLFAGDLFAASMS
jgi:hypothetical protein